MYKKCLLAVVITILTLGCSKSGNGPSLPPEINDNETQFSSPGQSSIKDQIKRTSEVIKTILIKRNEYLSAVKKFNTEFSPNHFLKDEFVYIKTNGKVRLSEFEAFSLYQEAVRSAFSASWLPGQYFSDLKNALYAYDNTISAIHDACQNAYKNEATEGREICEKHDKDIEQAKKTFFNFDLESEKLPKSKIMVIKRSDLASDKTLQKAQGENLNFLNSVMFSLLYNKNKDLNLLESPVLVKDSAEKNLDLYRRLAAIEKEIQKISALKFQNSKIIQLQERAQGLSRNGLSNYDNFDVLTEVSSSLEAVAKSDEFYMEMNAIYMSLDIKRVAKMLVGLSQN